MRRRCFLEAHWCGRNGAEKGFDKSAGLLGVQFHGVVIRHDPLGHFPCMGNDEGGHRPSFQRGGTPEQLLVRSAHASDETFFTVFFGGNWHAFNVCLMGTHFNIGLWDKSVEHGRSHPNSRRVFEATGRKLRPVSPNAVFLGSPSDSRVGAPDHCL